MRYSLPKKWRTRYWAGFALLLADMILLAVGVVLGGGVTLFWVCVLVLLAVVTLTVVCCLKLRCPVCDEAVDRQALLHDHFFCPKCGTNISME